MQVCLMIEGQEDVSWDQWLALAQTCERGAIEGLFRSDHFLSVRKNRDYGSLDAWATLAGLAARTHRIRLGTLVSPATFRHPSALGKIVATVDHISGGRVELGMGAGWFEEEHRAYGFPFPDTSTRLDNLAEQLEVIHRQWTEDDIDISGNFYRIEQLRARPKPVQSPHPPLIVGGGGGRRTVAIAALWADEYNSLSADTDTCRVRRRAIEEAWEASGRDPATARLSLMLTCVVGRDRDELRDRARRLLLQSGRTENLDTFLRGSETRVVGLIDEVIEQLRGFAAAGVDRVMLQHLLHDDLEMVELIGNEVAPAVAGAIYER